MRYFFGRRRPENAGPFFYSIAATCLLALTLIGARGVENPAAYDRYQLNAQRLESLTAEQRDQLRRNRERFENLSPDEQDRLRNFHENLMQRPDREELLVVMDRYSDWLKTLRPTERAEVLSLPPSERLERIREIRRKEYQERFGLTGESGLDQQDLAAVYAWVEEFIKHQHQVLERRVRDLLDADEGPERGERFVRMALRQPERARPWALYFAYTRTSPESAMRLVTEEHIEQLRAVLSDQAQRVLDDQPTAQDRQRLVHRWIVAAVNSRLRPKVTDEDLQQFYNTQLSAAERDRLDNLTPEMWWRELQRLYYARQAPRFMPPFPNWVSPIDPDSTRIRRGALSDDSD